LGRKLHPPLLGGGGASLGGGGAPLGLASPLGHLTGEVEHPLLVPAGLLDRVCGHRALERAQYGRLGRLALRSVRRLLPGRLRKPSGQGIAHAREATTPGGCTKAQPTRRPTIIRASWELLASGRAKPVARVPS